MFCQYLPVTAPARLQVHAAGSLSDLASPMQLVPEPENPFSHHPAPLQTGRKLQATGCTQDASLAFEAAGMVGNFTLHASQEAWSCIFRVTVVFAPDDCLAPALCTAFLMIASQDRDISGWLGSCRPHCMAYVTGILLSRYDGHLAK